MSHVSTHSPLNPPTPELRALATAFHTGFATIILDLIKLWGLRFRADPILAPALALFYARTNRARARLAALMTMIAEGKFPAIRPSHPASSASPAKPRPRMPNPWPSTHGWFTHLLTWEATHFQSRLKTLLDDPAAAELLAAAPTALRHLRPIAHLIGLRHPLLAHPKRRRTPRPTATTEPTPRPQPRKLDWWLQRVRITHAFWTGDPRTHPNYVRLRPKPPERQHPAFRRPRDWP